MTPVQKFAAQLLPLCSFAPSTCFSANTSDGRLEGSEHRAAVHVDASTFGTSSDWPTNFSMLASAWSSLGAMNSIVGPPVDRLKVLSFCAPLRGDDTRVIRNRVE